MLDYTQKLRICTSASTERCFQYKGNYYEVIGQLESKNSSTRKWEKHVHYKIVNEFKPAVEFTREYFDFHNKFKLITRSEADKL